MKRDGGKPSRLCVTPWACGGPRFTDQDTENVINYLTSLFSDNSVLPKSPADMPGYKETVHHYSDDAMKIVYVEFETGRDKMPFSATPDKDGIAWIPMAGNVNTARPARSRYG